MSDTATETAPMPTDMDSAMAAILTETKAQSLSESEGDVAGAAPTRNEKGQFVSASGATNDTPPAQLPEPVEGAEVAVPEGDGAPAAAIEIPEGYVAVQALPEDRVQGFKVFDANGEVQAPDLTFKFNANGKEREATTDKLIRMAQMGVYNAEREAQATQAQTRVQHVEREMEAAQHAIKQRDAQIDALLTDPDFLARAQEAYYQHNTPEARAQRDRQALVDQQQALESQRAQIVTQQFVEGTMTPALDLLLQAYPTVSQDELAAKFFLAADPYRKNGVLQPAGHDALKRWVVMELEPQVRQLHEHRSAERAQSTQSAKTIADKAAADLKAAQVSAQKAKRIAGTALRPAGKVMSETKPEPVVRTMKDAEDAVLSRTMAAIRAG